MSSRQERLAALNGESRVFVCWACSKVRHIKDALARVRNTPEIICLSCMEKMVDEYYPRPMAEKHMAEIKGGDEIIYIPNRRPQ